jgi:hypothetical protein
LGVKSLSVFWNPKKQHEEKEAFIRPTKAWKYYIELTLLNNLNNIKSKSFKSASNTFLLVSLIYLRQQQILPQFKMLTTQPWRALFVAVS